MVGADAMKNDNSQQTLAYGDPIVLIDRRRRETYLVLTEGKVLNSNGNVIAHADIVGRRDGDRVESAKGNAFKAFRATFQQHVLNMQRYATIIYPKDIATILMHGDVRPGQRIVEGGLGSGALATALLQAIGPEGHLTTYEIKDAAINLSKRNIRTFLGDVANHTIHQADVYAGIEEESIDRVILDVPEPWHVVPHAAQALKDGGIFVAYIPTVLQVYEVVKALRGHPEMYTTWSLETLERPWHVTEDSARPEQRMVAHTGFLVFSRRSARWAPEDGASVKQAPQS